MTKKFKISKGTQIIIASEELKDILDSLFECYELIEFNTEGLVIDEKDTARIVLHRYGYLKHTPNKKVKKNGDKKSKNKKARKI